MSASKACRSYYVAATSGNPKVVTTAATEFLAEAIAVPIALALLQRYVRGRDCIVFCDNASAVAALIRGASHAEDAGGIAELFHVVCLNLGSRVWLEWIDSLSNPADGLSRAGVHDSWTSRQEWRVGEVWGYSFPDLPHDDPWCSAASVVHWGAAQRW